MAIVAGRDNETIGLFKNAKQIVIRNASVVGI
jgi:hypothetical protein